MLIITSSSFLISLSLSLILSSSPLAMGLWVLLIALISSWFTSIMFSSWFAFIIFLIYIGGMLVMFAYFTALTPNQPLGLSTMLMTFMSSMFLLISVFAIKYLHIPNMFSMLPSSSMHPITILMSPSNSLLFLSLAAILFLILIAVVKIANITFGPLRPFLYV